MIRRIKEEIEKEEEDARMELKRRVDEGHKKWRMQLEDTKRHQEVKRKSYYSSRVSMN